MLILISLKYLKPPRNRCAKINARRSIKIKPVISTMVHTVYTHTLDYIYELRDVINKLQIFSLQCRMYDYTFSVSENGKSFKCNTIMVTRTF